MSANTTNTAAQYTVFATDVFAIKFRLLHELLTWVLSYFAYLQLEKAKSDAEDAAQISADELAKHKAHAATQLQAKEQEVNAAKDLAAKEKQRLESEMQEQKAAAAASETALQKRMEGEMSKQKAEAEGHLAKTVKEWEEKVSEC